MDWSHELFIREVAPEWGNSPKSKILVVTRDKNVENKLIEKCRAAPRTNHMDIRVTEWVDYPNLEKEIYPDDSWRPTMVVITFNGAESDDIFGGLQADMGAQYQDGSKFKFRILHLLNIFNPEQCILLSTTETNARAVKQRLRAARLENKATTRVLVIAGGHGGFKRDDDTNELLEHNGPTGFTRYDLLDPMFYREDCETVGIAPRSDTDTQQKPVGKAQEKAATARPDCLMNDESFKKMKFNVLDIAEFHKEGEGDGDGLMKFIRDFKPTVLMISWCFSTTCDLAMLLRREGVFGTMFATYDLRTITGDPNAELSDQQKEVLENYREVKDVLLAGPYGVGKTIMLCELAKAAMAEKGWETAKVIIFCSLVPMDARLTPKLMNNLEDTFKPVRHRDVKVQLISELIKEFPEGSNILRTMGRKMEEEGTKLIVVADECRQIDEKLWEDFKSFKHTKFLLALTAHTDPPTSSQQIVKLRSQYRNTEKILAFVHFQLEFRNEMRKTTGNHYFLPTAAEQADPGESLPKPLPSSPHPVVWLPVPQTQDLVRETLEAMKCILPTGDQLEVVVLYESPAYESESEPLQDAAKEICRAGERELGTFTWKHYPTTDFNGCEAPVVILLGYRLSSQASSRARNQLVIVTTGKKMELTEEFYSKYEQRESKYSFTADEGDKGVVGGIRDMLQLSADLGKLQKMGEDKRTFQTEF
jgi:hypothetical protein